jgi:hypothetical protein
VRSVDDCFFSNRWWAFGRPSDRLMINEGVAGTGIGGFLDAVKSWQHSGHGGEIGLWDDMSCQFFSCELIKNGTEAYPYCSMK